MGWMDAPLAADETPTAAPTPNWMSAPEAPAEAAPAIGEQQDDPGFLSNLMDYRGFSSPHYIKQGKELQQGMPIGAEKGAAGLARIELKSAPWLFEPFGIDTKQTLSDLADVSRGLDKQSEGFGIAGNIGEGISNPVNIATLPLFQGRAAAQGLKGFIPKAVDLAKRAGGMSLSGALAGFGMGAATPDSNDPTGDNILQNAIDSAEQMAIGAPALGIGVDSVLPGMLNLGIKAAKAPFKAVQAISNIGKEATPSAMDKAYKFAADKLTQEGKTVDDLTSAATTGGIPQTLPEQLESPSLLKHQRQIGELPNKGGSDFAAFNADRFENEIPEAKESNVANIGGDQTMMGAGDKLSGEAKDIFNAAIEKRKAATRPLYKAIENETLPDEATTEMRADPLVRDMHDKVTNNNSLMGRRYQTKEVDPELPPALQNASPEIKQQVIEQIKSQPGYTPQYKEVLTEGRDPNRIDVWNTVKKELRGAQESHTNEFGKSTETGARYQAAIRNIDDNLVAHSPVDAEGNSIYKTANEEFASQSPEIRKLAKGPIGAFMNAKSGEAAAKAFHKLSREQLQEVVPMLSEDTRRSLAASYIRQLTDEKSGSGIGEYIKSLGGGNAASNGNKIIQDRMQLMLGQEGAAAQQELVKTLKQIQQGLPRNSETVSKGLTQAERDEASGAGDGTIPHIPVTKSGFMSAMGKMLGKLYQKSNAALRSQMDDALMQVFLHPDLERLGNAMKDMNNAQKQTAAREFIASKLGGLNGGNNSGGNNAPAVSPAPAQAAATRTTPAAKPTPAMDELSAIAAQHNIDPAFFKKLSGAESPRDPTKPNPPSQQQKGSHAAGLYQFEPGTWKEMVDKYGAKYGVGINDIYKPKANAQMAAEYLKENHTALKSTLGREPTKGELYAAHFLGAKGALQIIKNKTSNQPATLFVGRDQVRANPDIFYHGTSPRTVKQVYSILARKVN